MFIFIVFLILFSVIPGISQDKVVRPSIVINFPDNGPDLQFYNRIDENDTLNRWRYTIHWNNLIEYTDSNLDGIFDSSTDTLEKNVSIQDIDFYSIKTPKNLTGINDEVVTGSQLDFYGNVSVQSKLSFVTISIGWWNGVVLHPYGTEFIKVDSSQSKYSITLENWTFASPTNRLALLMSIDTTTNKSSYDINQYSNGTVSMLTKENPDGRGKRGGIINNPNITFVDETEFKPMNVSLKSSVDEITIQYSFPSFSYQLLYDPTYAAVAFVANSQTSYNTDSSNSQNTTTPIFGFEYISIIVIMFSTILRIKKRQKM
jgi:hypothetical protein